MFCFHDTRTRIGVAFTDRHGGVSAAPYDALNLGMASGDDPAAVEHNYDLVADRLGAQSEQVARMHQVHGSDVAVVLEPPGRDDLPKVDAMVTVETGLLLSVRAADCVPVLLADPGAGVVGCAHAGRSGLADGVVPNVVETMREQGARAITGWVGPHVCGRCYEVPEEMRADVSGRVPETHSTTSWGTPALDLGAGVEAQLRAAGCRLAEVPRLCTVESPDLFSHRRDGQLSGRSAGLVWMLP